MKILDVGSERSAVTNALSKFGNSKNWEVFGIDIVQGLPQIFKDKEMSRFVLFRMDARLMGFRDEVFDKIICISTVEHIGIHPSHHIIKEHDLPGDVKAFSEIFRTLKKGGRVVLTVPYADKDIPGYHKTHRIYNSSMLARLITGFRVKKEEYYIYIKGKWKSCRRTDIASKLRTVNTEIPLYLHSRVCLCLLLEKK